MTTSTRLCLTTTLELRQGMHSRTMWDEGIRSRSLQRTTTLSQETSDHRTLLVVSKVFFRSTEVSTVSREDSQSSAVADSPERDSEAQFSRMLQSSFMAFLKQAWKDMGASVECVKLAELGWKQSTKKVYKRVWRMFKQFLVSSKAKDFLPMAVVNFLGSLGHSHKASTLSSYSSAILAVVKFAFPKQWEADSRVPILVKTTIERC